MNTTNLKIYIFVIFTFIIFVNAALSDEFEPPSSNPQYKLIINTTSRDINCDELIESAYRNDEIVIVHTVFNPSRTIDYDYKDKEMIIKLPQWLVIDPLVSNIDNCNSCSYHNDGSRICWYDGTNQFQYINMTFKTLAFNNTTLFSYIATISNSNFNFTNSTNICISLPEVTQISNFGGNLSVNTSSICIYNNKPSIDNFSINYNDEFQVPDMPKYTLFNGSNITLICNTSDDDQLLAYELYNNITNSMVCEPFVGGTNIKKIVNLNKSGIYEFKFRVIDDYGEYDQKIYDKNFIIIEENKSQYKREKRFVEYLYIFLVVVFITPLIRPINSKVSSFYDKKQIRFNHFMIPIAILIMPAHYFEIYLLKLFLFIVLSFVSCTYLIKSLKWDNICIYVLYVIVIIVIYEIPINSLPQFSPVIILVVTKFIDYTCKLNNETKKSTELFEVTLMMIILYILLFLFYPQIKESILDMLFITILFLTITFCFSVLGLSKKLDSQI
jgi:hypothetical protein